MTSDELLTICQEAFPRLKWRIDYYDGEPDGARADIGEKGIIILELYEDRATANFGRGI